MSSDIQGSDKSIQSAIIEGIGYHFGDKNMHAADEMPRKNRFPLDIEDLRQRIESCRGDVAWREMSLTAKIRTLILERLEQLESKAEDRSP
ncbi:MAG TPA: hypothetical protein V6C65_00385 [Allocoleopsis sp.]